ncbi:MAG: hypothetical protein ACI9WV_001935, partial [Patiriisocius sp.]
LIVFIVLCLVLMADDMHSDNFKEYCKKNNSTFKKRSYNGDAFYNSDNPFFFNWASIEFACESIGLLL